MAISLNSIEVNVRNGYDIAHDVATAADDLRAAYSEGLAIIDDLRGYWTGDNALAYITLLEERIGALNDRANKLDKGAGAMRDTVALYEQTQKAQYYAEQRAREEAAERKRASKKKK